MREESGAGPVKVGGRHLPHELRRSGASQVQGQHQAEAPGHQIIALCITDHFQYCTCPNRFSWFKYLYRHSLKIMNIIVRLIV